MWGVEGFGNEDQGGGGAGVGGGGGGGYFNATEVSESPAANAKRAPKRAQNIVPAMIGHLLNSEDELTIWGIDVQIVTIVGIVNNIEASTTKYTYEIEDETGIINAFRWLEADKPPQGPAVEVNTYVRIYGSLREQSQRKHILILRIEPITDLNELTSHLLEVIFVNLKGEKLESTGMLNMMRGDSTDTVGLENSLMDSSSANVSGMNNEQKTVFQIIQAQNESTSGIFRTEIKSKVPKHMASRVDSILDFLASEGHIYTTLTDDHFKTT